MAADPSRNTYRVLAGQSANVGVAQHILSANVPNDSGVPAALRVDAFAIAPYFEARSTFSDEDLNSLVDTWDPNAPATVDMFLRIAQAAVSEQDMAAVAALFPPLAFPPTVEIRSDVGATTIPEQVAAHLDAITAGSNLSLIAYEGGQHYIVPNDHSGTMDQKDKLETLYDNVVNDPRMYCVYWHYFDSIARLGYFVHYTEVGPDRNGDVGRFGALESVGDYVTQGQAASPVYKVLGDYTRGVVSSYFTDVVLPADTGTGICAGVP